MVSSAARSITSSTPADRGEHSTWLPGPIELIAIQLLHIVITRCDIKDSLTHQILLFYLPAPFLIANSRQPSWQ